MSKGKGKGGGDNDTTTMKTRAPKARTPATPPTPPATPPVPDLFAGAKAADSTMFKVKSKKERDEVPFGDDLDRLGAVEVLIDALSGLGEQLKGQLKERAMETYADRAMATKSHPSSFLATGKHATASVEMRRRASNHGIDPTVVDVLVQSDVSIAKNIRVPERWVFNHGLLQQAEIRQAISEAFSTHPKLSAIAGTLIEHQAEEYQWSTTEMTLQDAAAKLSKDAYTQLVPFLSSVAIGKWHLDGEQTKVKSEVTPGAKAKAIELLQEMGVLPATGKKK
jgi:hypothetical protein